MQNREQLYKYEGFLPLTRKQIIDYMKDGNQLTKRNGKFYLTGGIPVSKEVKGIQKVVKIIQKSSYSEASVGLYVYILSSMIETLET